MTRTHWLGWVVLAAGLALAEPTGPVLGSKPSGILNEQGAQVGRGPALALVGPAPQVEPRDRYLAALRWLQTYLQSLNALDRDMVKIKMALHTGAVDLKELGERLRDLRQTRERAYTDGLRNACDKWMAEADADSFKLADEQDKLIAGAHQRWSDLKESLAAKIDDSGDFPELQRALRGLQQTVTQKEQLADLELELAAGHHQAFGRLALAAEQNPALQMPVLLMKVADYMDTGDGRSALYAARLGLERYPDSPAFKTLCQGLDVSYLKAISIKAAGDGAEIHRLWDSYAGEVSDSVIKQFFFGGVRHTLDLATGKAYDLELIQKDAMLRSAAEHNGLEVIWRLRDKGLSLDAIRALDQDQLQQSLGLKAPLAPDNAQLLHTAVEAAYYNPDLKRLLSRTKDQFDLDTGQSYYGAKAFDTGLLEYAADAINVKNVLLFMGPSAVVKYGASEAGWLARASRLGVSGEAVDQSFTGAVTVRDWVLAQPTMQEALQFVGSTRAGGALKGTLEGLRALRYEASAPVQVGLGVAEAGAELLLFEAGGKIGRTLGGDFGEFVGQALMMLAGNPITDLQAKDTKAMQATAEAMTARRIKWEASNKLLDEVRLPVRDAVDQIAAGQTLKVGELAAADAAAAKAKTLAVNLRAGGDSLSQAAADEAEALANAGAAVKKGDAAGAQAAEEAAQELQQQSQQAGRNLQQAEQGLRNAPPGKPETVISPPATAEQLTERLDPRRRPAPPPPLPTPPPPEPTGTTPRECTKLGDTALQEGRFTDAERHFRAGFELDRLDKALDSHELAYWQGRVREAKEAAEQAALLEARGTNVVAAKHADQALEPFDAATRKELVKLKLADTEPITGTTGGPRKVVLKDPTGKTAEVVGIWKPAGPPNGRNLNEFDQAGQLYAEVLYSRIARKLGLRVPHAERWVLQEVDAAGQVVAHDGVLIRFIPDSAELAAMPAGTATALKKEVAKFRVLQVLTGNYDIHLANWRVDAAGHLWSIDAGMAMLKSDLPAGFKVEDIARFFRVAVGPGELELTGQTAYDLDRLWRDLYRNHHDPNTAAALRRMDDLALGQDMAEVVRATKRLKRAEYDAWVDELMTGVAEAERAKVKATFDRRLNDLDRVLGERWPGATTGAPPPVRQGSRDLGWRRAA